MLANVIFYLDETPRVWFHTHEVELSSWDIFKERLRDLFGNPSGRQQAAGKELATGVQSLTESKASTAGTGSAATQCPIYKRLHTFLGNLPMNDRSLVQESFQLDMVERLPEGAEIVASRPPSEAQSSPDTLNVEASTSLASTNLAPTSEASTSQASTPAASSEKSHTRKRRQPTSSIDKVVPLLERQENRAEKMAKKEYKLSIKTVSLQEEANDIHREMVTIIRQYIESRQERQPDCPDSPE
nr:uncharacterized protein LOC129386637 [Dermacentor andersoni]